MIVVKNFSDDAIDSKLQELGVVNLHSDQPGLGAKVYEFLQVARGEVRSLLEDDDEFLPGKLQRVYSSLKAKSPLDFYRNGGFQSMAPEIASALGNTLNLA